MSEEKITREEYDQIVDAFELVVWYPEGLRESHWDTYRDVAKEELLFDLSLSFVKSKSPFAEDRFEDEDEDEEGSIPIGGTVVSDIFDEDGVRVSPFTREVLLHFAKKETN